MSDFKFTIPLMPSDREFTPPPEIAVTPQVPVYPGDRWPNVAALDAQLQRERDTMIEARVMDVLNYPARHQCCGGECFLDSDRVKKAHQRIWRF